MKNIGYIGSQKCVFPKNFDIDYSKNLEGLNYIFQKFPHLENNWTDFVGGNIFWISNEVLDKYLTNELIEYLMNNCSYNKPPCNSENKNIYTEFLCERLFTGSLCYDRTNILVNNFFGTKRGHSVTNGKIDNKYFYQPSIFSFHNPKNIIT